MPRITFTKNLQSHVACPPMDVEADTVREALEQVFVQIPKLRSYILDDQGALRKHMNIFVSGEPISDRKTLGDAVHNSDEIYVMQALSGG